MKPFDYIMPQTLKEASAALTEMGGDARFLAGGTDLTVGLKHGHLRTDVVIDLKRVKELKSDISLDGDTLRISAGTTMSSLVTYFGREGLFPALRDAAAVVGSIQIRNRATLVGNICNASPAADTVPVLAALNAHVEIGGPKGIRKQPIVDFIQGNRQIDLSLGEIVTAVCIPLSQTSRGTAFDRIARRRGVDLATANLCCTFGEDGQVVFAFGSVAPRPLVVKSDDSVLVDPQATKTDRAEVISSLCAHATPITDVRASAEYRAAMLRVMAERALGLAKIRYKEITVHAG